MEIKQIDETDSDHSILILQRRMKINNNEEKVIESRNFKIVDLKRLMRTLLTIMSMKT